MPAELYDRDPQSPTEKFLCWLAGGAFAATLGIQLLLVLYRPYLNHDVAFNLTVGKMIWNGAVPYVDFIDTNPPMSMYLCVLPAALAGLLGVSLPAVGLLFFFALVVFTGWCLTAALELSRNLSWTERFLVWALWLCFSIWEYQLNNFAQRDFLVFLFLAPFVCFRHARYAGIAIRPALTLLLAAQVFIALSMKPQYLLPLVMVELVYMLAWRRIWRPVFSLEVLIVAILGVGYLLHFLVVPGMSAFYTTWLPFTQKGYAAYAVSRQVVIARLLGSPYFFFYLASAMGAMAMPVVLRRITWLVPAALGAFSLGSLLVCIQQSKGWFYHRVPFFDASLLALLVVALLLIKTKVSRPWQQAALAFSCCGLCLMCCQSATGLLTDMREKPPLAFKLNWMGELLENLTRPTDAVVVLGPSITPAFPDVTYTDRTYGSRFLVGYPIVFIFHDAVNYAVPEQWQTEEPLIYQMIEEDLVRTRPKLVLVRSRSKGQGLPESFIYAQYLKNKGLFDTVLKDYRKIGFKEDYDVYYLPERRPNADGTSTEVLPVEELKKLAAEGMIELEKP